MHFFRQEKQYSLINNFEELLTEDYIYVLDSEGNRNYETSIQDFGKENVIIPSEVSLPMQPFKEKALVKISVFSDSRSVNADSPVMCIIYKKDISNLAGMDFHQLANRVQYRWGPTARLRTQTKSIREIYFVDCKFSVLETHIFTEALVREKILFANCLIQHLLVDNVRQFSFPQIFPNCIFDNLSDKSEFERVDFGNCTINNLISNTKEVRLKDLQIKLFSHRRLDIANIISNDVRIKFDEKILKRIDKDRYRGYLNTYNHLVNVKSFNSERTEIEKYIAFFESRDDIIKKILFWFHRGYTKILIPLLASIFFLLLNFSITYYEIGYTTPDALATVFYPVDFFRKVIFFDFSFYNSFSLWKLLLFITELFFFYSLFCLGFAVKKKYGFKIIK